MSPYRVGYYAPWGPRGWSWWRVGQNTLEGLMQNVREATARETELMDKSKADTMTDAESWELLALIAGMTP